MAFSTYYDSADTGLGGVNNTAGSLLAFLNKVLVNGYNSQTLTSMTCSGNIVTATLTAHGFRERQMITISGATPSGYNGTWQIIVGTLTSNTFQFQIGSSGLAAATGTLAAIVAPLGWTAAFTGTNLTAYRAPSGNQLYCRIDDTGTTSARLVGYESMTDVNTGTNPFPTVAQASGGLFIDKSNSSTAIRTYVIGNQTCFWLLTDYANNNVFHPNIFGDIPSFKSGDIWNTIIGASTALNVNTLAAYYPHNTSAVGPGSGGQAVPGMFMARASSNAVGSIQIARTVDQGLLGYSLANGQSTIGQPVGNGNSQGLAMSGNHPVDGGIWTQQVMIHETAYAARGILPGMHTNISIASAISYMTIFQGYGDMAGKEFLPLLQFYTGSGAMMIFEISNTW
jgi:hypothetical protein